MATFISLNKNYIGVRDFSHIPYTYCAAHVKPDNSMSIEVVSLTLVYLRITIDQEGIFGRNNFYFTAYPL